MYCLKHLVGIMGDHDVLLWSMIRHYVRLVDSNSPVSILRSNPSEVRTLITSLARMWSQMIDMMKARGTSTIIMAQWGGLLGRSRIAIKTDIAKPV